MQQRYTAGLVPVRVERCGKSAPAAWQLVRHVNSIWCKIEEDYGLLARLRDRLNGLATGRILNQRSNDMLTANNWNVVQYAVLLIMFAQVSGLKAGELVHVIADAHIYDRHIPLVKEILQNSRHKAPKLIVDMSITNFYDFTVDSFQLVDYEYERLDKKIPVAI